MRLRIGLLALWVSIASGAIARASESSDSGADSGGEAGTGGEEATASVLPPSQPLVEPDLLAWDPLWPKFGAIEYVATALLVTSASIEEYVVPPRERYTIDGALPLDREIRDLAIRAFPSESARRGVTDLGDILLRVMIAYPVIVDGLLVSWGIYGNSEVAYQISLISVQSLLLSSVANFAAKRLGGRPRPAVEPCDNDQVDRTGCPAGTAFHSFYSGHAAMAFTSAGLVCVHQRAFQLYGEGLQDAACGAMLVLASITGLSRVGNDAHWFSDVAIGAAAGFFSGYFLPSILHYGVFDEPDRRRSGGSGPSIVLAPSVSDTFQGLSLSGSF